MSRTAAVVAASLTLTLAAGPATAALEFTPAAGYSATEVWRGSGAAHFAMDAGSFYLYGAEQVAPGQWQNIVRRVSGATTTEIARSPTYATNAYLPDAITAVGNNVYWAHVRSSAGGAAATLYKTAFDGQDWQTTTIFDQSAGINIYSLSTDGQHVFGVGLGSDQANVAFYLDDADQYRVLAHIPAEASGGSGFDPAGAFFAGAWSVGGDWADHMYEFSAQQVADRLAGTHPAPYTAGEAVADHLVPGSVSPVMESNGPLLFGTQYNATWSGLDPYAYDLATGDATTLGTLSGADTAVCTDLYCRDGAVYFLAKDAWTTGGEAVIYRLVPEPGTMALLAGGALLVGRVHRGARHV